MMRRQKALALLAGLTLLVGSMPAQAQNIDLSLNLEFNDPFDSGSGGVWTVVGKADQRGISGLQLLFLDSTLNFDPVDGFSVTPDAFEIRRTSAEFDPPTFGLNLEVVVGDDLEDVVLDVGLIGGDLSFRLCRCSDY